MACDALRAKPNEKEISRVIALPGERIRIEKGQIFIDDKNLDTFYGEAHRLGMNLKELTEAADRTDIQEHIRNNYRMNVKSILESKETNKTEITVPEGQYYIIGDDWLRSADSRYFGTLSKDSIIGKVIGIKK